MLIAPEEIQEQIQTSSQLGLFQENTRDVLEMVLKADVDNLSPIEALNMLARMKKRYE